MPFAPSGQFSRILATRESTRKRRTRYLERLGAAHSTIRSPPSFSDPAGPLFKRGSGEILDNRVSGEGRVRKRGGGHVAHRKSASLPMRPLVEHTFSRCPDYPGTLNLEVTQDASLKFTNAADSPRSARSARSRASGLYSPTGVTSGRK
eukprot:1325273-Amorphochlora_amoeboformis.AAC.1